MDSARLLIWHAYLGFLPKMSSWGHYFHEIYITWNLKNVVSVSYHTTDHSKMEIILVDSMLSFRVREPPIFSPLVPDCSSPLFQSNKKTSLHTIHMQCMYGLCFYTLIWWAYLNIYTYIYICSRINHTNSIINLDVVILGPWRILTMVCVLISQWGPCSLIYRQMDLVWDNSEIDYHAVTALSSSKPEIIVH